VIVRTGVIYTETVIYSAAEAFAAEVPFQTAIVTLDKATLDDAPPDESAHKPPRLTCRILGDRVAIGDRVVEAEPRDGVPFFQKA
jgi:uncharacterized OB-fold protein